MTSLIEDFKSFLDASPTSWHCVRQVGNRLSVRDFLPLEENSMWSLERESRYFVTRGGSLAAFCLPKQKPSRILLAAAHTDSPALKIKHNPPVTKQGMSFLETEPYGSPILHSWLNRDLALAGRVFFIDTQGSMKEELLFLDDIPLLIPEPAIHLHREVNEKGPLVNAQDHLMPLLSLEESDLLTPEKLFRRYFTFDTLLSFDLLAVPLEQARFSGLRGEMLASYRLDNLTSVHAAACALASYQDSDLLPLTVFWDHEEVGSTSWEGAGSTFLNDILERLRLFYEMSEEEFLVLKNNSLCLSLDMAHGLNPLHGQKYDPNHQPLLGKGIALKQHANLRYASSARTIAQATMIARKAKISLQHFSCRSDMPCGSTVGPTVTANTGIPTVDLGVPQLSMHSIRELIAVSDYSDLVTFLTQAFSP